jgi:hypothetical protein
MHLSENSKKNEFQGPPRLFKIYSVTKHLNNKFQNLYLLNQNIAIGEFLTVWESCLPSDNIYLLRLPNLALKRMNSMSLASAVFGLF